MQMTVEDVVTLLGQKELDLYALRKQIAALQQEIAALKADADSKQKD